MSALPSVTQALLNQFPGGMELGIIAIQVLLFVVVLYAVYRIVQLAVRRA